MQNSYLHERLIILHDFFDINTEIMWVGREIRSVTKSLKDNLCRIK